MEDVLKVALTRVPDAISWDDVAEGSEVAGEDGKTGSHVTAH